MNLHDLVRGAITTINPDITATLIFNTGFTQNADYSRVPTTTTQSASIQVQAVTEGDLARVDGLSINEVNRVVYLYGHLQGINRPAQHGGDMIQFPEYPGGAVRNWLTVQVLESWPDWTKVFVTLQRA